MKSFLPFVLLSVLAACGGSEPAKTPPAASSPAAASSAEQAAPARPASAAAASAPAPSLGGVLAEQNQAKWQSYACSGREKIEVRYYKSKAGPAAQFRFKGININAPYSPELSDEDLSAFSNGEFTWTISNLVQTDFYRESDGFLIRHEQTGGTGDEGIVDGLLLEECSPVK